MRSWDNQCLIRQIVGTLQIADVAAQVALNLRTDFAGFRDSKPGPSAVVVMHGVLVLLGLLAAPSGPVRFGLYGDRLLPASSLVARTSRAAQESFRGAGAAGPSIALPQLGGTRSAAELNGYAMG
ncbi:hypothetical protein [Streptomyces sp. BPTC-684]|uniref:hypothetical protein n=1 Tax=Streptomyces sp. BPTC-684 TaxID=3043734 RepID=UPI0024B0B955|nr:hypothetical protein [Streptomyces sp. BPTC-684]WHM40026.1 hypothetical protein QIY60_26340 [Streptomyces sp. BPTC-684]